MIAEIITVGDELITGHILNSNAAWLSETLLEHGVKTAYQTTVGDDIALMESAFRLALERVDLVLVTGGLGPTDDDMTKKAIVKVFQRNLVYHEEILEDIQQRYAARGINMPAANQNQALLPQGAKFLPNRLGSAVGIQIEEKGTTFLALPGVPQEMKSIVTTEFLPWLAKTHSGPVRLTRKVRTSGIGESALAERIDPEIPLPDGVKLAYLPHYFGVDLRLMASANDRRLAEDLIEQPQGWLKRKLGPLVYGEDSDTLESVVGALLRERGARLALAESCTAGMIAARLVDIPGSSDYFERGYVTYSDQSKVDLLHVRLVTLKKHGAVSKQCALEMAAGALDRAGVDFALSVTGIAGSASAAGPAADDSDEKPVGLTYIAVAQKQRDGTHLTVYKFLFGPDRRTNRERATAAALNLLRLALLGEQAPPQAQNAEETEEG